MNNHFLVSTPEISFTFIGGAIREGRHVWLCTPTGKRVLRVPRKQVRQVTAEETARRIVADIREHRLRN